MFAADWSAIGTASETLSLTDNLGLADEDPKEAFGSRTALDLAIKAATHVSLFELDGGLAYQTYWGDAADSLVPNLRLYGSREWKRTKADAEASYRLEDTGVIGDAIETQSTAKGDREIFSARTTVAHKVDGRNDIDWSLHLNAIDYDDYAGTGNSSLSIGTSAGLLHRETRRTSFKTVAAVDWTEVEDAAETERVVVSLRETLTAKQSERLTYRAGAGVRLLAASRNDGADRDSTESFGFIAEAGFDYRINESSLTGTASYGLTPTIEGDLIDALTLSIAGEHQINALSKASVSARLRMAESDGGDLDQVYLTLSPAYTLTMARDWNLSANYRFQMSADDEGTAIENAFFLTVSRQMTLLP